MQGITRNTPCSFAPETEDHDEVEFSGIASGPGVGMDEEISMELMETTAMHDDVLKLWPWVNQVRLSMRQGGLKRLNISQLQTPLTVAPQLPLEIVMQLFKRMGPRVILVEDHGVLCGLVTVKDVLKYTLTETGEMRTRWDETQFEGIVEATWTLVTSRTNAIVSWCRRMLRR